MTLHEYLQGMKGKTAAVIGLGVSNRPLVRLLLQYGAEVTGCDKTPREKLDAEVLELERMGAKLHLGEGYLEGLSGDVAFRTPGLHPAKPELAVLRAAGTKITSEMEAFFEVCPCTRIAVTGSDGKTTTTTLIAKILEHAGKKVWIGGNRHVVLNIVNARNADIRRVHDLFPVAEDRPVPEINAVFRYAETREFLCSALCPSGKRMRDGVIHIHHELAGRRLMEIDVLLCGDVFLHALMDIQMVRREIRHNGDLRRACHRHQLE